MGMMHECNAYCDGDKHCDVVVSDHLPSTALMEHIVDETLRVAVLLEEQWYPVVEVLEIRLLEEWDRSGLWQDMRNDGRFTELDDSIQTAYLVRVRVGKP